MNRQSITKSKQKIQGIAAALAVLLWPSISQAHLVNTGLGPIYDGISHLAMSPDDLLTALALAPFQHPVISGHRRSGCAGPQTAFAADFNTDLRFRFFAWVF
jgi:hypothetical protein